MLKAEGMRFFKLIISFSVYTMLTVSTSHAETRLELPREPDGIEVLLGIGGGYDETAYKSEESFTGFAPVLAVLTKNFYLDIHEISYKFEVQEDFTLKLYGLQDDLPNPDDISPELNIKSGESFDVGLYGEKTFSDLFLGAGLDADVTGTHNGYRVYLSSGYEKRVGKQGFGVEIGASYQDKKRNDYYFGVSAEEANNELETYIAEEDISVYLGASYAYAFTKNLGIYAAAKAVSKTNAMKKSPRIKEDAKFSQIEAYVNLIWQFSVYGS